MDISGILGRTILLIAAVILLPACAPAASSNAIVGGSPTPASQATPPPLQPATTAAALQDFVPTATFPPATATRFVAPPTPTPFPTMTPMPSPTSTPLPPSPTPTSTATPRPTVDPRTLLNGKPFSEIAVLSPEVAEHVRLIYQRGQELGRNPAAFSKLGDSLVLTGHYLTRFDHDSYNLGPYEALQPVIEQYAGSWSRYGVATAVGLHAADATRPGLANGEVCPAAETKLDCEFRLHNPSALLIRTGTNDTGHVTTFETAVRRIVEYAIANGVIPILGTKADRFEGDDRNNDVIRQIAAEYRLPLWDYDLIAGTLPDRGLSGDNVHLTLYQHNDYTDPATYTYGYPLSDLSALIVLDAVQAAVAGQ